jgi:hypothetical protein
MFKSISNPYIVGNPIKSAKMFYGRTDDFQYIKTKLEDGGKSYIIVLCGERRSGKTSILFQILSGRLGENFVPILVDMQTMAGLKNDLEFFEKFAQETSKSLKENIQSTDLFKTTTESSYKAFSVFLDSIHKKYADKHIIFLIDEYEIIESKIEEGSLSENFIPFIAGTLESDKRISFIFTGSSNLEERKGNIWQVLFGKSLFRNVSFLSRQDTERLIKEPVEGLITYDPEVVNLIYKLTYGQPFYTQVVCQNIVDYVNQKHKTHIQLEDLEVVISEILENPLPQMIYFWNSLQDDKKLILSLLAEIIEKPDERINPENIIKESKRRKFGLSLTIKEINTTLEALFHSDYVSKSSKGFCFQMDLFRRWIKRDHAIWRVMKEVSNLGQASSVTKMVFDGETENQTSGRLKVLTPVFGGVFIILLLLWLLFPENKQNSNEADKFIIEQKAEESAQNVNEKKGIQETQLIAEKERNEKKGTAKLPEIQNKESKTATLKSPNQQKSRPDTPSKEEKFAENDALSAKQLMLQDKESAAKATSTNMYAQAKTFESEGNTFLGDKNFNDAKVKFNQAGIYYKNALNELNNSLAILEAGAVEQQKQLNKFKQKLKAQYTFLDDYKTGQEEEKGANSLLTQGKYEQAIQMFKDAENSYSQAISTYSNDKEAVSYTINSYLDGIQNESISQMKKYHSNFSNRLQNDWQGLFDYAENITVDRSFKNYKISSVNASAEVDVTLDYKGADKSKTRNNWNFNLEKKNAIWIISSINDSN